MEPIDVFISYPHSDREWLTKIEKGMILLKREGAIKLWFDGEMTPGTEFAPEIASRLAAAKIILLLISTDFFVSDYCWEKEMMPALARHQAESARVVPIIVRPCEWRKAPFAHLTVLPTNEQPLSTWPDEDSGLLDIFLGLRRTVQQLQDH